MSNPVRVAVVGAGGRMGRALIRAIGDTEGAVLAAAVEQPNSSLIGQDAGALAGLPANGMAVSGDVPRAFQSVDVAIDFTAPAASVEHAKAAAAAGCALVIGATGFSAGETAAIAASAKRATIVKSGNMSLGVNLLAALVRKAARALDPSFDIEIVEMHHRAKVDAPSGTALLLGEAAAEGRAVALSERSVRVRDGHTGPRVEGTIGFATLRGGTVIGDHTVLFAGPHERLELRHIAEDRGLFARGAVKAALWAPGRPHGLYSMADVLGLND